MGRQLGARASDGRGGGGGEGRVLKGFPGIWIETPLLYALFVWQSLRCICEGCGSVRVVGLGLHRLHVQTNNHQAIFQKSVAKIKRHISLLFCTFPEVFLE
jgi:hypothetical protein